MSINTSGLDCKVQGQSVTISIPNSHPLIKLAANLNWSELAKPLVEDLKETTALKFWWLGRALYVRVHLAVYLLQKLFDKTDRQIEKDLQENPAYMLFAGYGVMRKWKVPDHTKVETFRNRLSPETQRFLCNQVAALASELNLADPSQFDVDSTVQEANMAYPADCNLMVKLAQKAAKVVSWLKRKTKNLIGDVEVDMTSIKAKAKGYFFLKKNTKKEVKENSFAELHSVVKKQVYGALEALESPSEMDRLLMPWNIQQDFEHLKQYGKRYLLDVAHFIREGSMKAGKILSFHLKDVCCIYKNKAGKNYEFGRIFQLGRVGGNFVLMGDSSQDLRMNDKSAMEDLLQTHESTFGTDKLKSTSADRGYYSRKNEEACSSRVDSYHLGYMWEGESEEEYSALMGRRAGVEPVIGHIKKGGQLGRSRMKSDTATLAAGYGAGLGFNLRQLMRKL
jgi:hypothetical protein